VIGLEELILIVIGALASLNAKPSSGFAQTHRASCIVRVGRVALFRQLAAQCGDLLARLSELGGELIDEFVGAAQATAMLGRVHKFDSSIRFSPNRI
jgi:hypothetical protein